MPTTESFSFGYTIFDDPPNATSLYSSPAVQPFEFRDNSDGAADGMTVIGGSTDLYIGGIFAGTYTLWGFSALGDPIMEHSSGSRSVYSNNGGLLNDLIGPVTTGTYLYCFGEGTMIAAPRGEVAVETLSIGDLVGTADGRTVPVKWVARQTILTRFWGDRAQLVRIAAGALGNHSDLYVTADHGMVIDDLVINASALINGSTIDWAPLGETPDRFTVYHVETEAHDVILANGTPSESYLDAPGRAAFDNYAEYLDLYGAEREIAEMPRPRITSARLLPRALKARLGIRDDPALQIA